MDTIAALNLRRRITLSGLSFVLLFPAGSLLLGELFGAFADSDAFFVAYYSSDAHHPRDLAGGYLLVVAGFGLLFFLHHLIRYLRALNAASNDLDLAQAISSIGVALFLTGAAAALTVTVAQAFGRMFDDEPLTSAAVALAPQFAYVVITLPALWAFAVAIGLLTWAGWSARIWPGWLRVLSIASVGLLLTSVWTFMPIVMLPAWVLGVSIWVWRMKPAHPATATG